MNEDFREKMIKTYGICGFTPQPANANLRSIAKIIAARRSDRECIQDLTAFLRLNGIDAGP